MTVDPSDMWAYATRPIDDPDPNGPLLAVLEAADAAEPRVVRASSGAMVDGRFEVPPRSGQVRMWDGAREVWRNPPDRDEESARYVPTSGPPPWSSSGPVPWSVRNQDGEEVAIIWSGPDTASITTNRPGCHVVKVTDPEEVRRYGSPSLPTPEQRTRRDVAAVIT